MLTASTYTWRAFISRRREETSISSDRPTLRCGPAFSLSTRCASREARGRAHRLGAGVPLGSTALRPDAPRRAARMGTLLQSRDSRPHGQPRRQARRQGNGGFSGSRRQRFRRRHPRGGPSIRGATRERRLSRAHRHAGSPLRSGRFAYAGRLGPRTRGPALGSGPRLSNRRRHRLGCEIERPRSGVRQRAHARHAAKRDRRGRRGLGEPRPARPARPSGDDRPSQRRSDDCAVGRRRDRRYGRRRGRP